jgi:hypothetical protein
MNTPVAEVISEIGVALGQRNLHYTMVQIRRQEDVALGS